MKNGLNAKQRAWMKEITEDYPKEAKKRVKKLERQYCKCSECGIESEKGSYTYRNSHCPYCGIPVEYFTEECKNGRTKQT